MNFSLQGLMKNFKTLLQTKRSVLGVDIGSSAIKVVQLRKEQERAILETYGEVAVGPYAGFKVGQNAKLQTDIAAQALKDVVKESNSKAKLARVGIPLKSSFIKIITLPFEPDKNANDVIAMEARRHIPVPVSEVALDWWVIPKSSAEEDAAGGKGKSADVLLVAIHNDVINEYKEIITKAGLEIAAYEIESFSMIRSAINRGSQTIGVFDIGSSSVKMAVVDYGIMKSSHLVTKGSQELTLALSQSLGVDFERAEEMKREIGLSDLPEHKDIVAVMEPILDHIFYEAGSFLGDFQAKYGRSVSKVILTGGGSLLKGIAAFGVKKLTVEVEYADPFAKAEHPVFLSHVLKGVGANFSVATGLALGEL